MVTSADSLRFEPMVELDGNDLLPPMFAIEFDVCFHCNEFRNDRLKEFVVGNVLAMAESGLVPVSVVLSPFDRINDEDSKLE